jgi:phosphohistidine phosphatase
MKTLYLLRHAKSSWRDANLNDIDRPLKRRGIKDAYEMAGRLAERNLNPGIVLSSPAARAIHTAIIFCRVWNEDLSPIVINEKIYNADNHGLFAVIRSLPARFSSAMIVGHDPTLTNFFNQFVKEKIEKIPTSGFIALEFDHGDWQLTPRMKPEIVVQEFVKRNQG